MTIITTGALLNFLCPKIFTDLNIFNQGLYNNNNNNNHYNILLLLFLLLLLLLGFSLASRGRDAVVNKDLLVKAHYMTRLFLLRLLLLLIIINLEQIKINNNNCC